MKYTTKKDQPQRRGTGKRVHSPMKRAERRRISSPVIRFFGYVPHGLTIIEMPRTPLKYQKKDLEIYHVGSKILLSQSLTFF